MATRKKQLDITWIAVAGLVILAISFITGVIGFFIGWNHYANQPSLKLPDNQVACTLEAKLCPDGSYVGRTGPNCEFSACPGN